MVVWHGKQEMPVARTRETQRKNKVILPLLPLELRAPFKTRWVWAGAIIFSSATCSLQFAKASAAALSQQEKNYSTDVQRGRINISGFISPAHKRTEGRAPVWGSVSGFTSKDAILAPRGAWLRQKSCQEISCSRSGGINKRSEFRLRLFETEARRKSRQRLI
jgi:hypothetical protein